MSSETSEQEFNQWTTLKKRARVLNSYHIITRQLLTAGCAAGIVATITGSPSLPPSLQALHVSLFFSCCSFSTAASTCHLSLVPKATGVRQPQPACSTIQAALYPHFPQCTLLPQSLLCLLFKQLHSHFPWVAGFRWSPCLGCCHARVANWTQAFSVAATTSHSQPPATCEQLQLP